MPLQQRTTDYHCHILPGIDDGPSDEAGSVSMARLLYQAGYREVYCTPHLIKGMYAVSKAEVIHVRGRLQATLDREAIDLRLLVGREYYLDEFFLELFREPQPLEGTNHIMIEIPSHVSDELVRETLYTLCRKGYVPMIAHPERCQLLETRSAVAVNSGYRKLLPFFNRSRNDEEASNNPLLGYLRQLGCQFQVNLGSLKGQYGSHVKVNARFLETKGFYTHAGTDAHSPDGVRDILAIH